MLCLPYHAMTLPGLAIAVANLCKTLSRIYAKPFWTAVHNLCIDPTASGANLLLLRDAIRHQLGLPVYLHLLRSPSICTQRLERTTTIFKTILFGVTMMGAMLNLQKVLEGWFILLQRSSMPLWWVGSGFGCDLDAGLIFCSGRAFETLDAAL